MTRVVRVIGPPCRMETCGTEEPYEGKPHVRTCGGAGWATTGSTRTPDRLQRPLRSRFRRQVSASVGRQSKEEDVVTLQELSWVAGSLSLLVATATFVVNAIERTSRERRDELLKRQKTIVYSIRHYPK